MSAGAHAVFHLPPPVWTARTRCVPARVRQRTEAFFWRLVGIGPRKIEVRAVGLDLVLDAHKGRSVSRNAEFLGHNQRDRLAAKDDPVVVKRPERRTRRSDLVTVAAR